jgi:alkyldihydroxyacetonephosphate synthase
MFDIGNKHSRYTRDQLKWNGWGREDQTFDLEDHEEKLWRFLRDSLGMESPRQTPAVDIEDIVLPKSRLGKDEHQELTKLLGDENVNSCRYERLFHAVGKSYFDLIRVRSGNIAGAPDAVLYPQNAEQITELIALAKRLQAALIPYGGGSSVVGGVEAVGTDAHQLVLTVDMTRMSRVLSIDEESLTARIQTGIYGPELEAALQAKGYTLGHYPQSFEFSTLGGWIAARGSGQQSNRYGGASKFLVAAQVVCPSGLIETHPFPSSAAGPDLNHLILGSEGVLGFITEAIVRIRPVPAARDYRGFLFKSFEDGAKAIRHLLQEHVDIAMARLSDADETWFLTQFKSFGKPDTWQKRAAEKVLGLTGFPDRPCLLLTGIEGNVSSVAASKLSVTSMCMKYGGLPIGSKPGRGWYETRFMMPYLRDPLLDQGIAVDTLETSTSWSNLHRLHTKVRASINDSIRKSFTDGSITPIVMAHISHSYPDGASLYFTFIFPRLAGKECDQWHAIKRAASESIQENGGTISHHHGVGIDHRNWMPREKGALGVRILRDLKSSLDPDNLLNPSKLLP